MKLIGDSCMYHQYKTEETSGVVYCDFDLMSGEYAWVDESTQHINSIMDYEGEDKAKCPTP